MAKTQLPAFMRNRGLSALDVGDLEVPRLKVLQAPSLGRHGDKINQCEFFHGSTDERLGSTVRVCPVYIDSRFILWRPREAGGGILARADDGKHWAPADIEFTVKLKSGHDVKWRTAPTVKASGLDKRGTYDPSDPNSPPAAKRMYSIVCAFPDRRDLTPAVVILQGAAIKAATKLIDRLKDVRAPSFGVVLEMAATKEKSSSDGFCHYGFNVVGPVEDRALYEENFAQYRFFMEQGLKVKDLEGAQEE